MVGRARAPGGARRRGKALNHQKEREQKKKMAPLGPNLMPPDFLGAHPSVRLFQDACSDRKPAPVYVTPLL